MLALPRALCVLSPLTNRVFFKLLAVAGSCPHFNHLIAELDKPSTVNLYAKNAK